MTNENKEPTLEELMKEEDGRIANYNPISPDAKFRRDEFLKAQDELNDLEEDVFALKKNPLCLDDREKLYDLLIGEPAAQIGVSPEEVQRVGDEAYSNGIENMSRYVKKNYDRFMNGLDGNGLASLIRSIPLYKTSDKEYRHGRIAGNKGHNKLVELIDEIKAMNSDDEKIQRAVINNSLSNIMNSKEVSKWVKSLLQYFEGTDAHFTKNILEKYKARRVRAFSRYITKDGKPDKDKLRPVIDTSLRVANAELDELDEEKDAKERNDIWEEIRLSYLGIAKARYRIEKEKAEKDIPGKAEKNKRKAERNEIGMRV